MKNKTGTALYYSVKEKILERIDREIYQVGGKLPSESDLCLEFEVSRTTIRLALQQLEQEGRIYKLQGKGTFVAQPKIQETITLTIKSFSEQMKSMGLQAHSEVLSIETIPATLFLANSLDIQPNDPVFKLVRLRFAEQKPYQYSTSYVPWKVAPNLIHDDCSGSLFELLQTKYGLKFLKSIESIEPVIPTVQISNLLGIPENTPSFQSESLTYTTEMVPIEYSSTIVRGDFAKFVTERYYQIK
ncbi:GntR family transcriptional regulator [Neobacillus sp. BF23-41]|jgi:GntR family transcriptional regulator|uniref:GntR family transcriptional regulator n=1 Tax=Neobacillus sp. BF23-41 TaxID=3240280 RepID=UPI0034E5E725